MKYATVITLLVVMLPIVAAAQLGASEKVAWDRVIPAGNCIVQRATMYGSTLVIENAGAKMATFALSREDRHKTASGVYALVFHKYGSRHFLSQVKIAGGTVYRLPEGKLEGELRAQNITAPEQIVLASLK